MRGKEEVIIEPFINHPFAVNWTELLLTGPAAASTAIEGCCEITGASSLRNFVRIDMKDGNFSFW